MNKSRITDRPLRKAGCKRDGPSPWRRAYQSELRGMIPTGPGNPAFPAMDDPPMPARDLDVQLYHALAGNTDWPTRQYLIQLET